MAMSRKRKLCVAAAIVLALLFLILPLGLGLALRGTVEKKLSEALNAPVKLNGLYVTLFFPGAKLNGLDIGENSALTGGAPLASIENLHVSLAWGLLFGGETHVKALKIKGAEVQVGCDEKGASTLAQFLERMPVSERRAALPVDNFSLREARIVLHVPKKLLDPASAQEPMPVTIELRRLSVSDLLLPAPGQPAPKEVWAKIELSGLAVRSPLGGLAAPPEPEGAGEPIEEGLSARRLAGEILIPASLEAPLRIRHVKLEGLKARNVLRGPEDAETFTRIQTAREACLKAAPPKPGEKGLRLGNGSVYLEDLGMRDSELELQGNDGNQRPSFWRLNDLSIEIARLAFGPGAGALAGGPGHLKIASSSNSSAGGGNLLVEWTQVSGTWPNLSFEKKFELNGMALPPLSARVQRSCNAGVTQGTLASSFAGTTTNGKLKWDGSVTLSQDTRMNGKGFTGQAASGLSAVATGKPMETIRIRGTLEHPVPELPDFVAGAAYSLIECVVLSAPASLFKMFGGALGSSIDQGLREIQKLSDFFGGEEKTPERK